MRHLLLRLEGPLMAFGDVAVDERLPVARFPALSMVCGLIANAMGLCRTRPGEIRVLQDEMEIASRLDRPGHRLRDYSTAELDAGDTMWTSHGELASRDGGASGLFTVQLEREFWADASVTVAVAMPADILEKAERALVEPARPLFLGRASCPPSRPILLGVCEAEDILEALCRTPMDDGMPAELEAQWPDRLTAGRTHRISAVSDVKDWANRVHVGTRRVREGHITVEAAR